MKLIAKPIISRSGRVCRTLLLLFLFFRGGDALAQFEENAGVDSLHSAKTRMPIDFKYQKDAYDVIMKLIRAEKIFPRDTLPKRPGKLYFSAIPAAGYTLITGFAGLIAANGAFYTSNDPNQNVSSILTEPAYTEFKQLLLPVQTNIWTAGNKYNIQTDWSYKKFPQDTYGLGGRNSLASGYPIDYSHLRFYQTLFKTIRQDLFAGVGYYLDEYWNVREVSIPPGAITDFQRYGLTKRSGSSGFTLNLLYDLRRNLINPLPGGWYANLVYRENLAALGSDSNWSSLLFDFRKYVRFPLGSRGVLGFWTYNVITLHGKPPYLALPFTGCDTYINSGRGYIQGRFRGQNMTYFETELRFGITRNGFLGGVIFANVQSYSETITKRFAVIWPATGVGLRFKLNKFSNTNVAIDYGFGAGGSRGIFVNLGEVF
jgi:hypothetical protein